MNDKNKISLGTKVAIGYAGLSLLGGLFSWACGGKIRIFILFSLMRSALCFVIFIVGLGFVNEFTGLVGTHAVVPIAFFASIIAGVIWSIICPEKDSDSNTDLD